jgi:hypothetical protein
MKFPGRKLLQKWDLASQRLSMPDLVKACQQVSLTGFAEVSFVDAAALVFYYQGMEVNALFREGPVAHHGADAIDRLGAQTLAESGNVCIYELPLDVAHLLRGITNRRRVDPPLAGPGALAEMLRGLEASEHTGVVELDMPVGCAMFLVVRGRVSNVYFESSAGLTHEKGVAHQLVDDAVTRGVAQVHLSDFSRDTWMTRNQANSATRSRLSRTDLPPSASVQIAARETEMRGEILEDLLAKMPGVLRCYVFDLMTGSVLCSRSGARGGGVGPLVEMVPVAFREMRERVSRAVVEPLETMELATGHVIALVHAVESVQEALMLVADRTQPNAHLAGALARAVALYVERSKNAFARA